MGRTRGDLSKQSKVTAGIPWRVLSFMTGAKRKAEQSVVQTCNPWGRGRALWQEECTDCFRFGEEAK